MTVLRQRHKNLILAGSIGFLVAMVIILLIYIFAIRNNPKLIEKFLQDDNAPRQTEDTEVANEPVMAQVYIFNEGLKENDIIKAEDFSTAMYDEKYIPEQHIDNPEELIGKKIKCDTTAKMIAIKTMVYEEKKREEIKEAVEILNISVPEFIQESDEVNLRIHYPTGQDFLVLEDVLMSKIYEERLGGTLQLNHNEIICLSSAKEDVNLYPGTLLYYTKDTFSYRRPYIGEALRNAYPVNPNTMGFLTSSYNETEVYEERLILDESLKMFFDQNTEAYSFIHIEETIKNNNNIEMDNNLINIDETIEKKEDAVNNTTESQEKVDQEDQVIISTTQTIGF